MTVTTPLLCVICRDLLLELIQPTCVNKKCYTQFVAGSFHIKKLCSRLLCGCFDASWILLAKTTKSRFVQSFRYTVYLWLVGKGVVDFLLVLIELFSPALTVEALWADIGWNRGVRKGGGSFWAQNSAGISGRPPTTVGVRMRTVTLNGTSTTRNGPYFRFLFPDELSGATPTFAGGQAEGLCQVWMELSHFVTMSDGIVIRYARHHGPNLPHRNCPFPGARGCRSPSNAIWHWIGQGQPPCIGKRHLDPVQLFKHIQDGRTDGHSCSSLELELGLLGWEASDISP